MRRGTVTEGVQHAAETLFHDLGAIACDLESTQHDVRQMVPDGARGQFHAVADDVVLIGVDRQRILRVQRLKATLRHGERVVREVDLPGFLVQLVHREVHDPAETEGVLLDQVQLGCDLGAHHAGEFGDFIALACGEEHGIPGLEAADFTDALDAIGFEVLDDRALAAFFPKMM